MVETVGKIQLDYSHYSGEDLYSDGAVEEELLEIVRNHEEEEFNEIIVEKKSWPILYHLAMQRQNIVEWLPIKKTDKVLEIGAGCGAITGALAKKAQSVKCIELSKQRSLINAYRNKKHSNISIQVGNFEDIELDLEEQYDYITLIGVFEYAQSYISTSFPFENFLEIVMKHLKNKGQLIIAIENKLGLKYWAGCKEDHLGSYFSGLENYQENTHVKTFSKKELEDMFDKVGMKKRSFYYPYPDYKFPTQIYTDEHLPQKGELVNNIRNFDDERMLLFDESKVFDSIISAGLFPEFSNSYLIRIEKED